MTSPASAIPSDQPDEADSSPTLAITPRPSPDEAAAIMAALHHHRQRTGLPSSPVASAWRVAARREALRPDWATIRDANWCGRAHKGS